LEKVGIRQIVSRPRHPQTLGKIDRFWGSLWRECVETAVFMDLGDARTRIGHFIDHYNFQRPHQGLDGAIHSQPNCRAANSRPLSFRNQRRPSLGMSLLIDLLATAVNFKDS